MKRLVELVLAPIVVGLLLVIFTGPVQRLLAPSETATVTTFDTGVRLSATKLRGIADQVAPPAIGVLPSAAAEAADAPTMVDQADGPTDPTSPVSAPSPSPSESPSADPAAGADRLAVYFVDVRNDGSTVIGGKRFDLNLAPQGAGQSRGAFYRVGNDPDVVINDRRNMGLHIRPDYNSAWVGVPRLDPGAHFSGWVIGEADRTLAAIPRAGGLAIHANATTRDRLFPPPDDLRSTLWANGRSLTISFVLAFALLAGAWWVYTRIQRGGAPVRSA